MTANPLTPLTSPTTPMVVGQAAAPAALPRFSPIDPIRLLRQYAKWVILAAAIGFLIGAGVYALQRKYSPEYTSTAQLIVTGGVSSWDQSGASDGRPTSGVNLDILINNQIVLLHSDDLLNEALQQPRIRETTWFKSLSTPDQQLRALRDELSAGNTRGTNIVSVTLTGKYWGDLKVILGEIINVYLRRYQRGVDDQQLTLRKVYFTERDRADKDATNLFDELKRYKTEHQLPDIDVGRTDVGIAYEQLATQRVNLQQSLEQATDAYRNMVAAQQRGESLVPTPDDMAMVDHDPAVAVYIEQLRGLREERQVERSHGFGENHPNIKNIDDRIQAAEMAKKKEEDRLLHERQALQIEAALKNLQSLDGEVKSVDKRLEAARSAVRDMNEQIAKYKEMEQLANAALQRRQQLDGMLDKMRIMESRPDAVAVAPLLGATDPERTSPVFATSAMGGTFLLGGVVLALAFVKELLDQRVKSPADIKLFHNAKLIGIIPDATEDPHGPAQVESAVRTDPGGLIAESFRQVRTALLSRIDRRGYKTLMVVCAQGGCGASTIVSNLALSLAYNGRRVLVLDANLRRPVQHEFFATPVHPGLIEVLRGTVTLDQAIVHKDEPRLDVLPAGDANEAPPEIVETPAFRQLLAQLESRYDLILIDVPPALVTSESQLLSQHVDAVVMVLRAMQDKRGTVGRMIRQLEGRRAESLGVILNGVRSSVGGYFRKSYEEFYRYSGGGRGVKQIAAEVRTAEAPAAEADAGDGNDESKPEA